MTAYPMNAAVDTQYHFFYVLREASDVIKMGRFRVWDGPPLKSCPVRGRFFRRFGMQRIITNE